LGEGGTRRISVETDAAPSYLVHADPAQIERVLVNLLTNALKYSAEGAPVRVTLLRRGGSVQVEVIDCGIGIAPESLKPLFDRYYRAPAGKGRAKGLGLGLYIARMIVLAHGGQIDVSSEVGKGSVFRLELPARAEPS
jgi:signal transduction histidine kinase